MRNPVRRNSQAANGLGNTWLSRLLSQHLGFWPGSTLSFGRMPWNYQPGSSLCALGCESLPSITLCPRAFCWGLCHSSPYPACSKHCDLLSLLWGKAHICSIWWPLTRTVLATLLLSQGGCTQVKSKPCPPPSSQEIPLAGIVSSSSCSAPVALASWEFFFFWKPGSLPVNVYRARPMATVYLIQKKSCWSEAVVNPYPVHNKPLLCTCDLAKCD